MSPRAWIRRGAAAAAASAALIMAFQPAASAAPHWRSDRPAVERVTYSPSSKPWKQGNNARYRTRWTPPAAETNQAAETSARPQAEPAVAAEAAAAGDGSVVSEIIDLTNAERAKAGLAPLKRHDCLTKHAQDWSNHMSSTGRMYHSNLRTWMSDCSFRSAGENVAYGGGSAERTMEMWMNSSGHRANILDPGHTHIGVGWAAGGYATQMFAS